MKKLILLLLLVLSLSACHTTEENYRSAYVVAKDKQRASIGEEAYKMIEAEKTRYNTAINGDSVRLIRGFAILVSGDAQDVHRYGVVVAEFKQILNANTYRSRVATDDHLPAIVLQESDTYLVIAKAFDEKTDAANFLKHIDKQMKIKRPIKPWIFEKL